MVRREPNRAGGLQYNVPHPLAMLGLEAGEPLNRAAWLNRAPLRSSEMVSHLSHKEVFQVRFLTPLVSSFRGLLWNSYKSLLCCCSLKQNPRLRGPRGYGVIGSTPSSSAGGVGSRPTTLEGATIFS